MQQTQSRATQIVGLVAAVLAVVGAIWVVVTLWHFASSLVSGVDFGSMAKKTAASVVADLKAHGPEWSTAIGTAILALVTYRLWAATNALARAANLELAVEGPYMTASLLPDAAAEMPQPVREAIEKMHFAPYLPEWHQADVENVNLAPLLSGAADRQYVSMILSNRATKGFGVAADVRVRTRLYFGASAGAAPNHPFFIERETQVPTIEAGTFEVGHLFDVTGLLGFMASIEEVTYRDIFGRDKRAASGLAMLNRTPGGGTRVVGKVFKPRGREFTDGIRD